MEKPKITFEYSENTHTLLGKQTIVKATVEANDSKFTITKEFGYVDYNCRQWIKTLEEFFTNIQEVDNAPDVQ